MLEQSINLERLRRGGNDHVRDDGNLCGSSLQQMSSALRSSTEPLINLVECHRPKRSRGRPRLGTNAVASHEESLPQRVSAGVHRNHRRRERRLLHRGKHTENCKHSSTTDLA